MTLFEYLAAGYVLMLSFAVLRAMSGVPYAVRASSRYWVHISWLATALVGCLGTFWAFWPYRDVTWTIYSFVGALAIPALLYVYVSLLVPLDPSTVTSWRDHFFEVRTSLFGSGVAFMLAVIISNQSTMGVPPLHPSQLLNYFIAAIYLIGAASAKPAVHVALAAALPTVFALYLVTLLAEPDAVFRPEP